LFHNININVNYHIKAKAVSYKQQDDILLNDVMNGLFFVTTG